MSRRKARELAFKVLFQVDQVNADPREAFRYLAHETTLEEKDQDFSRHLVEGCLKSLDEIDEKIAAHAHDWSFNRLSSVDRNVMRLACYEILYIRDLHPVIAIDEAIEIAKRYGDENSGSFVNAVLDKILGEQE